LGEELCSSRIGSRALVHGLPGRSRPDRNAGDVEDCRWIVRGARHCQPSGPVGLPRHGVEDESCSSRTGRELSTAEASMTVSRRIARAGNSDAARFGMTGGTASAWRPRGRRGCRRSAKWRWRQGAVVTAFAKVGQGVATGSKLGQAGGRQRPRRLSGGNLGAGEVRVARRPFRSSCNAPFQRK